MRMLHRPLFVAVLALILSACATRSAVQEPIRAPAPAVVSPTPANAAPLCVAGNGQVVRLAAVNPANDTGNTMNGGVLGSVLGDDQQAHPATAGSSPSHDIYVQMDDGRKIIASQRDLGGIGQGSRVAVDENCRAHLLR